MAKVAKTDLDFQPTTEHDHNPTLFHKLPKAPDLLLSSADKLLHIEIELCKNLRDLKFGPTVEYIYNPLEYAIDLHTKFLRKYLTTTKKIMFLGMNPGPWGMCQNGIPFGERAIVKDWFKLSGEVGHPEKEHPSKKILGLDCKRSEVSGKRFWSLVQDLCETPERFFKHSFVYNICPLSFLSKNGKNITPAELKREYQNPLNKICDEAFLKITQELEVKIIIGIGKFAEKRAADALKNAGVNDIQVVSIPHPSPRNAKFNNDWIGKTKEILKGLNLIHYF